MRNLARRPALAAIPLLAALGFAGCGGSSSSSSASAISPGPYGGPSSQGMGVGIVVAKDGKGISAVAVRLTYSCPKGATQTDSAASGPTSPVALNGGSFATSWSAHGSAYKMSGAYSNGSFTGSLSGTATSAAGGQCQSGKVNWSASPSAGTVTSSGAAGPAKTSLAEAARAYNTGAAAFNLALRTDAHAGNLPAFKADVAAFRNVLFEFDRVVHKIHFSAAAQPLADALHSADGAELADLDAIRSATSPSAALRLYAQVVKDNPAVIAAQQKLAAALK
jgi:hypothetical protein